MTVARLERTIQVKKLLFIGSIMMLDNPEFFGTRVGCHVSAVEWV